MDLASIQPAPDWGRRELEARRIRRERVFCGVALHKQSENNDKEKEKNEGRVGKAKEKGERREREGREKGERRKREGSGKEGEKKRKKEKFGK